jgi:hypothetical protein
VNPHIVDNKLVSEAMLRAYRNDFGTNPQVPKMYDDGARIASMLVPQHPEETKDQMATGQPAPGATSGRQPMMAPKTAGAAGAAPGGTVIREQDLRAPAGAAGAARGVGVGGRPAPIGQGQQGVRQWNRPEPTVQEVPGGGDEDGAQPAPSLAPPPSGVYYRPGVQSTGRLNLQVAPVQGARR